MYFGNYGVFFTLCVASLFVIWANRCERRDRHSERVHARSLADALSASTGERLGPAEWSRLAELLPGPRADVLAESKHMMGSLVAPMAMVLMGAEVSHGCGGDEFGFTIGLMVSGCVLAVGLLLLSYEPRSRWAERCARWPLYMFVEAMNLDFDEQTMWLSELDDVTRSAFLEQRDGYIASIGKMSWAEEVGLALVIFSGAVCVGSLALCVMSLPW